tara:strand:- start:872 stop:1171 length:300 start_codon:yes stop_codon:yes gene_type:complete
VVVEVQIIVEQQEQVDQVVVRQVMLKLVEQEILLQQILRKVMLVETQVQVLEVLVQGVVVELRLQDQMEVHPLVVQEVQGHQMQLMEQIQHTLVAEEED